MNTEEKNTVLKLFKARIALYSFLASIYMVELTEEEIRRLREQDLPDDDTNIGKGYQIISKYLKENRSNVRQNLAVDYAHTFLGAGSYEAIKAPPYESVFTSSKRLLMQDARDKAVKFYRSEGFDLPKGHEIPEDHISYEMQFMEKLIEESIKALKDDEYKEFSRLISQQALFFKKHLENWIPAFADAILEHSKTDFYKGIAYLTLGLIETEKEIIKELKNF